MWFFDLNFAILELLRKGDFFNMAVDKNNNEVTNVRLPKDLVDELRFKYQIPKTVTNLDFLTALLIHSLDLSNVKKRNYNQKFRIDEALVRQLGNIDENLNESFVESELSNIKEQLNQLPKVNRYTKETLMAMRETILINRLMFNYVYHGIVDDKNITDELTSDRTKKLTQVLERMINPPKKKNK